MALCIGAGSFIGLAGGSAPLVGAIAALAVGGAGLPVSLCVSLAIYRKKDF